MNKNTLKQFNEIHLAFIELSKQINEVLEEQNIDISREQMGVFKLLMENKKMSMKDIAYRQGVYKTAITKRIKKMKDKGFVKKVNSVDKREKLISLTSEGYEFYQNRQELLYKDLEKKLDLSEDNLENIINHMYEIKSIIQKG
ncbi:MarR family winged helix-turn-helix transcriptional regulator [Staphylococcus warneri]|uniref:MarR family winged helix-turn-helix transcriptional regulator n=1 Tax=Staphylococcus warneri TaxID=1292 RepID=UPI00066B5E8B|nr:MarR family transcriptional regulator [Staphylococcus warneri]MBY6177904.1 winged helix-turn-helix transcriptional regulator [Staphylococcaceae bacterium DP2N0-1]RQM99679.1 MarR family transcriptional regulator [Staphylococcus warneri]